MTKQGIGALKRTWVVRDEKSGKVRSFKSSRQAQRFAERQEEEQRDDEDVCYNCGKPAQITLGGKDYCRDCYPKQKEEKEQDV